MGRKLSVFSFVRQIDKDSKTADSYNTGLFAEHIIVASYEKMETDKLEKMRFIINKIIKKRKEYIRVNKSNDIKSQENNDENVTNAYPNNTLVDK